MGYRNTQVKNGSNGTRRLPPCWMSVCPTSGFIPRPHLVTVGRAASPRPPSSTRPCGAATNTLYAVTDPLGTVHALVDSDGTVTVSYTYDSWGNVLSVSGDQAVAAANRFIWQGREYSRATGLHNFRARWYDPAAGRWLSKDPIGLEGGLNLYEAFGNNPVCFRDPSGNVRDTIDGSLIEVHKYDADTWPSSPQGHFVEDRNLKIAADGKIWNKATKKVVGKLSKKGLPRFLKLISRSLVVVSILSDFFLHHPLQMENYHII